LRYYIYTCNISIQHILFSIFLSVISSILSHISFYLSSCLSFIYLLKLSCVKIQYKQNFSFNYDKLIWPLIFLPTWTKNQCWRKKIVVGSPASRETFWWRQKQWWQQDWNGHQRCDQQSKPAPSQPVPKQLISQEVLQRCCCSCSPPQKHSLQISRNTCLPPQLPTVSTNKQNHDIVFSNLIFFKFNMVNRLIQKETIYSL